MIEWIAKLMPVLIVITITVCDVFASVQAWRVMSHAEAAWGTIVGAIGVSGWWVALWMAYRDEKGEQR